MKVVKKVLVSLMVVSMLVLSVGGQKCYALESDNIAEVSILRLISKYMAIREINLDSGIEEVDWDNVAVIGIINDEEAYANKLLDAGVEVIDVTYLINSIDMEDFYNYVELTESMEVIRDGVKEEFSIVHNLEILYTETKDYIILADKYWDSNIDFKSCSYVTESAQPFALRAVGGAGACITYIASCEEGYREKASNASLDNPTANAGSANYTKYGAWYGANPAAWCAIFVSWCANQADVSTNIIPKFASVDVGRDTFKSWGKYQKSAAYGGTYIPKEGDIYFTGIETDASHTGIVFSVSGSTVTVISGNSSNRVKKETLNLTDSSILGYATPAYASSSHQWNTLGTSYGCSICGMISSFPYSLKREAFSE